MEFLVRMSKEQAAMGEDGLRSVQKGNSSRPTGSFRYPSAHDDS